MTAKEKQILKIFAALLPNLSVENKAFLLGYGEGLAASVQPKTDSEQ